jgi:hypothetical protein
VLSLAEVEVHPAEGAPDAPRFVRGDSDANGNVNITDGIYVLNFLFLGGPAPPEPYPGCGVDPDEDAAVDCAAPHPGCGGGP